MSYVIATPEMMATAAFDLARIGSQVSAASAVAAMPTTEVRARADGRKNDVVPQGDSDRKGQR